MNTKNVIISVLAIVVLAFGTAWTLKPTQTVIQTNGDKTVGALAGPDIPYQWMSNGGVLREYRSMTMKTATTSLCAMLSPAGTSTLAYVGWQITTGTTTAATIDTATSTTAFATTTNLVAATSIASGAQGLSTWRASAGSGTGNIMAPSTYVNVKTAGAGLGGYTYTGKCYAVFDVL